MPRSASASEVYRWPELKALCVRLGIAWDEKTTRLCIDINIGRENLVTVKQECQGVDCSGDDGKR